MWARSREKLCAIPRSHNLPEEPLFLRHPGRSIHPGYDVRSFVMDNCKAQCFMFVMARFHRRFSPDINGSLLLIYGFVVTGCVSGVAALPVLAGANSPWCKS